MKDLTKVFPNRDKKIKEDVVAVDHFTIEIPDGKLVGLLGPSGCGKSTLLNLISGLETPSEGQLFFGDDDVTNTPPELRGIGLVFQSYALYPHLTVLRNITFPLENLRKEERMSREEMDRRALEVAKLVQIDNLMERKPNELSGGQQQRVAIARALVKQPRVLLLDEPLSNLDARLRLQTREEIRKIQKQTGITTIFVTHDQEEAMSICDQIIVMRSGKIQQIGKPQDVYDDPINIFVAKFLGTPAINVFKGKIQNEKVYVNDQPIRDAKGLEDRDVSVAIRPEAMLVDPDGVLTLDLERVEVMGKDTSVVAQSPASLSGTIRAIVRTEDNIDTDKDTITFSISKMLLFDNNGERIRFVDE